MTCKICFLSLGGLEMGHLPTCFAKGQESGTLVLLLAKPTYFYLPYAQLHPAAL